MHDDFAKFFDEVKNRSTNIMLEEEVRVGALCPIP